MKKILLFLAFVGLLAGLYFYLKRPSSDPLYLSPAQQILPPVTEKAPGPQDPEILAMVQAINARNAKIRTFVCNDVDIRTSQALRVKISGTMMMEKDKKFRMKIRSFAGQEMDLGSNDTHFWFWSKRMDPPVLHYAKHEDLPKSSLKTPLNPSWMMASLNMNVIDLTGATLLRHNKNYGVLLPRTSPNGEAVNVLTLIDPVKQVVIGHYLYGSNGKLQASSEVKSHQKVGDYTIPKELLVIWYSEGQTLEMTLNSPQINTSINPSNWVMPVQRNSIDMGKDVKTGPKRF